MNYLVTGGAGFIGSHLVDVLVKRGNSVCVLDNLTSGKLENLQHLRGKIKFVEGDIRDRELLQRCIDGKTGIFHLAAQISVVKSMEDPDETYSVNVLGTSNVLDVAREKSIPRIIFASSCALYGNIENLPINEEENPMPQTPYAVSKLLGEILGNYYYARHGYTFVALRFFNVYGERQCPNSQYSGVISRFLDAVRQGDKPQVFGDGQQSRDFVYVKDVVAALCDAMGGKTLSGSSVYNVCTGRKVTLLDLLEILSRHGNCRSPDFLKARVGDLRNSVGTFSKIREELGWSPRYSVEKSIAAMLNEEVHP